MERITGLKSKGKKRLINVEMNKTKINKFWKNLFYIASFDLYSPFFRNWVTKLTFAIRLFLFPYSHLFYHS